MFSYRVLPYFLLGSSVLSSIDNFTYFGMLHKFFNTFKNYLSYYHVNLLHSVGVSHINGFFSLLNNNITSLVATDIEFMELIIRVKEKKLCTHYMLMKLMLKIIH